MRSHRLALLFSAPALLIGTLTHGAPKAAEPDELRCARAFSAFAEERLAAMERAFRADLLRVPTSAAVAAEQLTTLYVFSDWLKDQGRDEEAAELLATHLDSSREVRRLVAHEAAPVGHPQDREILYTVQSGVAKPFGDRLLSTRGDVAYLANEATGAPPELLRFALSSLPGTVRAVRFRLSPESAAHVNVLQAWAWVSNPRDSASLGRYRRRVVDFVREDPQLAAAFFHPALQGRLRLRRVLVAVDGDVRSVSVELEAGKLSGTTEAAEVTGVDVDRSLNYLITPVSVRMTLVPGP